MNPEQIEKNKQDVIKLVEETMPTIKALIDGEEGMVTINQVDFANHYEVTEILLLGAFVKYCGMHGKRVEIIVEKQK